MTNANTAAAILCSILAYDNFIVVSVDQDYVDSFDENELIEQSEKGELRWAFKDTGTTVGVSAEALALLQTISENTEAVEGEPDQRLIWNELEGVWEFSFAGPPHAFFHPDQAVVGAFAVGPYVEIENVIPDAAKEAMNFEELLESIGTILDGEDEEETAEMPNPPAAA